MITISNKFDPEDMQFSMPIRRWHHDCPHCNKLVVSALPDEAGHRAEAEYYREKCEKLARHFDQLVKDVSVLHGENPIINFIQNKWKFILNDLTK